MGFIFFVNLTLLYFLLHIHQDHFIFKGFENLTLFFCMNFTILAPFHYKTNSINTHFNFPNSFYFHFCHLQHLFLLLSSLPPLLPFFRNWRGHNLNFFISFVFKMCAWCSPFFLPISYLSFMKHAFHSLEELHKCGRQMKTTCSFQQSFFGDML